MIRMSGPSNIKGIEAQLWAALSLFLQHLKEPNFSHIHLEAPKHNDFNLVFSDGRKIICEVKNWKTKLSYSHIRDILNSITKNKVIGDNDEVMIICTKLDGNFLSEYKYVGYFPELEKRYLRKGFAEEAIACLPKVRFWVATSAVNKTVAAALLNDLINFWLPPEAIDDIINSIFVHKIFRGSANSATYSRDDIYQEIDRRKTEIIRDSGDYDERKLRRDQQYKNICRNVNNPKSPLWSSSGLKALSSKYDMLAYTFELLKNKRIHKLEDWDELWKLNKLTVFSSRVFEIFRKNAHNHHNIEYIFNYIKRNIRSIRGYYRHDFMVVDCIKTLEHLLKKKNGRAYLNSSLEIVKELINLDTSGFFYIKNPNDQGLWEKEQLCKLLQVIYERGDQKIKDNIFGLIMASFNVIDDFGEHNHYAPNQVYAILRNWLNGNFKDRFNHFIREIVKQYRRIYNKTYGNKLEFEGWDLSAHSSCWGNNYRVTDRHFVSVILRPAITKFYQENRNGWKFIKDTCISTQKDKGRYGVAATRPDFLNRAVCDIVLERYLDEDASISEESFVILKEFILQRRGIPHKSELIYQSVAGSKVSDEKKWRLVDITIKKYGIPVNPFVEKIVTELAKRGHPKSRQLLLCWMDKSEYYSSHFMMESTPQSIEALLDVAPDLAFEMFKKFINNDYFITKYREYDVYEVAYLLYGFLKSNYNEAISILNQLTKKSSLSVNEQILLCYGFVGKISNEQTDSSEYLKRIYDDFVMVWLDEIRSSNVSIHNIVTHSNAREAFLNFAEKLAKAELFNEALAIVEYFIADPDPYLPTKDPEDKEDKYNEHKRIENGENQRSINSIRGRCAWVLMDCAVPKAREYIPRIINLTSVLVNDENWYVKHMSTFAVAQLARNRLSIMPEDKTKMFFNDDKATAFEMAISVEELAFSLLEAVANEPNKKVHKAMIESVLQPFDHIRALNQERATRLLDIIKKLSDEAVEAVTTLIIYFAEFRRGQYKKCSWCIEGCYDDLEPFDNSDFIKYLNHLILHGSSNIRTKLGWNFWTLPSNSKDDKKHFNKLFKISVKYLNKLASCYDHDVYYRIYSFINDHIECEYKPCLKLWMKCVTLEKKYFEKNRARVNEMYHWPNYENGSVLLAILNSSGRAEFLKWFEHLSCYPEGFNIGNIEEAIKLLNPKVIIDKKIIDNLININKRSDATLIDFIK